MTTSALQQNIAFSHWLSANSYIVPPGRCGHRPLQLRYTKRLDKPGFKDVLLLCVCAYALSVRFCKDINSENKKEIPTKTPLLQSFSVSVSYSISYSYPISYSYSFSYSLSVCYQFAIVLRSVFSVAHPPETVLITVKIPAYCANG